ncbi:GNAT family N-acetyltransferase [Neptunicella marina]|uniref:GNAT family N-acetyltransferase n=1 Tax=Neptunicella marina TaxID=2125989 RepID=A0A8J6IX65_9ALTE|nr:N-acetyltransferase [Neptunicella marina]MBC3767096.1 GNAT family N-acetyltransferase [Neptunicella marina]
MTFSIRPYHPQDWPPLWRLLQPVFAAGETYAFATDISEQQAKKVWVEMPEYCWVVEDANHNLVGTYYLRTNHPGPGSHVCNCGYIVSPEARGRGLASQMCEHSQQHALSLGYRAMQFNFVVSSNQGAIRIWKKHGFDIVGTIPNAYNSKSLGFVDAYVMFKTLM